MGINEFTDLLLSGASRTSPFYPLFAYLIESTVWITVTVAFILLFKLIFRNRLRAKWHFLIWTILLIRLIAPVLPSSPVSVFNVIKVDEPIVLRNAAYAYVSADSADEEVSSARTPRRITQANKPEKAFKTAAEEEEPADTAEVSTITVVSVDEIVVCVWLGGAGFMFLYFTAVMAVYIIRLRKRRTACGEGELAVLGECKSLLKIRRRVKLCLGNTTPMIIGSTIFIPDGMDEKELRATLIHELCHFKHLDIVWTSLAAVILCLNWFNPIIWFCFFIFKQDIELYCDERTLKYDNDRQAYAMLLLKTASARRGRFVLGTTSLGSGKSDVKRRIRFLAKFRKPTVIIAAAAVGLLIVTAVCCLTNPVSRPTAADTSSSVTLEDSAAEPQAFVFDDKSIPELYLENAEALNKYVGMEMDDGEFGRFVEALPNLTYASGLIGNNCAVADINDDGDEELVHWQFTGSGIARFDIEAFQSYKGMLRLIGYGTISTSDGDVGMAVATADSVKVSDDAKALIVANRSRNQKIRVTIKGTKTKFAPFKEYDNSMGVIGIGLEDFETGKVSDLSDYIDKDVIMDINRIINNPVPDEKLPENALTNDFEIIVRFKDRNDYSLGFLADYDGDYWLVSEPWISSELWGQPISDAKALISVIHNGGIYVDYGESKLYSADDFDEAVQAVEEKFSSLKGGAGELYKLTYKGDGYSEKELAYCNKLRENNEPEYTQCIVFDSLFHTEKKVEGGWNADSDYSWSWYLAKSKGGKWQVVSYGY